MRKSVWENELYLEGDAKSL